MEQILNNLTKALKKSKKINKELIRTNKSIEDMLKKINIKDLTDLEHLYFIKNSYLNYLSDEQTLILNEQITLLEVELHKHNLMYSTKINDISFLTEEEKARLDFILYYTTELKDYFINTDFNNILTKLIIKNEHTYSLILEKLVKLNIIEVKYYLPCNCFTRIKNESISYFIETNKGLILTKEEYTKILLSLSKKSSLEYVDLSEEEWELTKITIPCESCKNSICDDFNDFDKKIIKIYKLKDLNQ